ncbi:hypothetical protein MMC20_007494 [Loxospora ochrophaea]|nr:hypothetical protein [Loxospora ochrophaea]
MCSKLLLPVALIAVIAAAAPYPLAATSPARSTTPFFGHFSGNFQPASSSNVQPDATGGVVSNPAIAVTSINNDDGIGAGTDSYTQYNGDGTTADGWPAKTSWVSFDDMYNCPMSLFPHSLTKPPTRFNANQAIMTSSCAQWSVADDSSDEINDIYSSIQQVATATELDHRFILAVIIQESGGCVRVPTTNYGVRNPGLMQGAFLNYFSSPSRPYPSNTPPPLPVDHDGDGTCNDSGTVQNPCPAATITEMISEGSAGTTSGDGLAQCINESAASDVSAFYKAARIYNSGSIDPSGDLGKGIATHCYSSDIANRLTGWVEAPHGCDLDG